MKKLVVALLAASTLGGCAYAGIGTTSNGKAVVARNDGLVYGALRKIFVCDITDRGLANCKSAENP